MQWDVRFREGSRDDIDSDKWSVYIPASKRVVDFAELTFDEHTTAPLHALRLWQMSGIDDQAALRFDGDDLDDLNGSDGCVFGASAFVARDHALMWQCFHGLRW